MRIFNFCKKQKNNSGNYKIGDTIFFGKYFFESEKNEKPIEWFILESNDTEMLLISKYCLDTIKYCETSSLVSGTECCIWENSYLRNWLNNTFYSQAFSEKEKKAIIETEIITDKTLNNTLHKNKVFVLSKSQVCDYFSDSKNRKGCPTPYALKKGANVGHNGENLTWWWVLPYIDATGGQPPRIDYPAVVCQNGEISYHSRLVYHSDFTVRPAIKIKK